MSLWINHVKDYHRRNPQLSYKDALRNARKTYKPTHGGGRTFGRGRYKLQVQNEQMGDGVWDDIVEGGNTMKRGIEHAANRFGNYVVDTVNDKVDFVKNLPNMMENKVMAFGKKIESKIDIYRNNPSELALDALDAGLNLASNPIVVTALCTMFPPFAPVIQTAAVAAGVGRTVLGRDNDDEDNEDDDDEDDDEEDDDEEDDDEDDDDEDDDDEDDDDEDEDDEDDNVPKRVREEMENIDTNEENTEKIEELPTYEYQAPARPLNDTTPFNTPLITMEDVKKLPKHEVTPDFLLLTRYG